MVNHENQKVGKEENPHDAHIIGSAQHAIDRAIDHQEIADDGEYEQRPAPNHTGTDEEVMGIFEGIITTYPNSFPAHEFIEKAFSHDGLFLEVFHPSIDLFEAGLDSVLGASHPKRALAGGDFVEEFSGGIAKEAHAENGEQEKAGFKEDNTASL